MSKTLSGWTSHGHRIDGVAQVGQPVTVARCGGPGLCDRCSRESEQGRKAAEAASLPAGIDGSTSPASVDPVTIPGPYAANLGDGANGRLSDDERVSIMHSALRDMIRSDRSDFPSLTDLVDQLLREHAERALAEVEQRIESRRSQPDHFGRASRIPFGAGLTEAIKIIRAARQEWS